MKIELLVSAMHQEDMSLAAKMNCKSDALIINQCDHEGYQEGLINGYKVRMISTIQRGLSKSRNMALIHAKGDICVLCDDDERMEDNYVDIISAAFQRRPEADIIAFNYRDENPRAKRKLIESEKRSSNWRMFSSVSLAFKRERVLTQGLWFDHRLGAGSGIIKAGEESLWQKNAIRRSLLRWECPDYITTVTQDSSTWFKGYNESYYYDIGANLSLNHPYLCWFMQLYYILRLRKVSSLSIRKQLFWMTRGMKGIKMNLGYESYKEQYK